MARARANPPSWTRHAIVAGGLAMAAVIGVFTAVSPVLGLALLAGLIAVAGFSRSATFGVCTFTAATYFEITARYTGDQLSPIKLAGGALIVVALVSLLLPRGRELPAPAWRSHPVLMAALAAFLLWGAASAAWAIDLTQVRTLTMRLVTDALVFLAVATFLVRLPQFATLCWTVLAAAVASLTIGLVVSPDTLGRATGTFTDPNDFAAALVPAVALGFGAVQAARSRGWRLVGAAGIAACVYGIVATQSRGGLFALAVVAAVAVATSRGRERVRVLGSLAVACAAATVVLGLTPQGQALADRFGSGDSSGRTDLWRVALNEYSDHPVRGVGLGNYPAVSKRYLTAEVRNSQLFVANPRTTHNTLLELMAELGTIGAALFGAFVLGCIAITLRGLHDARRLGDAAAIALGRGVLAALLGAVATGLFLSGQYQELLWVLLASGVAYAACVRRLAAAAATLR